MANWGGLNNALNSFRNGLNKRFPGRDTRTDGARADRLHGSDSEHQEDPDGTVDAFDCDINWLKSSDSDGNATEDRISEAVKADFMADPRSRLWIHDREISNKNVQNGKVRIYTGPSPHTEHIHFEAIQRLEDDGSPWAMPRTDALLRELNGEEEVTPEEIKKVADAVWDKLLNIEVDPKKPANMQKAGGIQRYTSSEHHQAIAEAKAAKEAALRVEKQLQGITTALNDLRRIVTGQPGS